MADIAGHLNLDVAENHSSYDGLRLLHALLYINKSLYVTKYNKIPVCSIKPYLFQKVCLFKINTFKLKRQAWRI